VVPSVSVLITLPIATIRNSDVIPMRKYFIFGPPVVVSYVDGCCPNGNPFERSLKRFLLRNLGEVEDKRCQLFEP